MNINPLSATFAVALVALVASDVTAVTIPRSSTANAVGRCQGALPNYEGAIRKRPLAVQNEGTASAFVTCAYLSDLSNTAVSNFGLYARSVNGTASTLSCTAVVGYDTGPVQYAVKSQLLPANGFQRPIFWDGSDFDGEIDTGLQVTISCALPAGAALNDTYFSYREDIGD